MFNILLQVLDDGRLTDNQGRTVDFRNSIIAMTSNIGSQAIQEVTQEGGTADEVRETVMAALRSRFLPEFLNRVDEIILFQGLTAAEIRKIVGLQIRRLQKQLRQNNNIELEVTEAAVRRYCRARLRPDLSAPPCSSGSFNSGSRTRWRWSC